MQPKQDKYPVFVANQVLTNAHLNKVFNYLDEQERLTRANLIGIGIVCGLEINLDVTAAATTIHLSRGCGVTSEGYLIVEPLDVALVSYKPNYKVPAEIDYPPFMDPTTKDQYPLWELFAAGEPNTTPLSTPAGFLSDKVVLLFLELKKEGLRNCSPNDCNDKGSEVTATVRRLLIRIDDLKKIIAWANNLANNLTLADLETELLKRLNLPDLRLPRYDVPNTGPVTSQAVLSGFFEVFHTFGLVGATGAALTAAYNAFSPVLKEEYSFDPFGGFIPAFDFLDTVPKNVAQVRFLQYYYDFFDDLIKAYDEFRWKGLELMCACCPPEDLFPRHLMLGALFPGANPGIYRHHFLASSAISGCEEHTKELLSLFRRLVEMIARFTNNPPLPPQQSTYYKTDLQIRITPSKLADVPLSDKAIPYYYLQNGMPALFELWNAQKTRRNRANQNLGYRSDEYTPTAPQFVTNALRFDLEPYNFLRIEGHLGKNYQTVLHTLLFYKHHFRLPIEIIALRTGAFDENMPVDLSKEACRFQDLEALYDTFKEDIRCFICKELVYFYSIPYSLENAKLSSARLLSPTTKKSLFAIFDQCDPDFMVQFGTMGWIFEEIVPTKKGKIDLTVLVSPNLPSPELIALYYLLFQLHLLEEIVTDDLGQFNFKEFELRYHALINQVKNLEQLLKKYVTENTGNVELLQMEEIDDRLEAILYACRLDIFKSIYDEYIRRIRAVKQKQFFSYFTNQHPGIQHKAGVPIGGTFILVYHDDPEPVVTSSGFNVPANAVFADDVRQLPDVVTFDPAINDAFYRVKSNAALTQDADIQFLLGIFTGQAPNIYSPPPGGQTDDLVKILNDTVNEMPDGTVIADFYLPYLCCSDCSPVQFVLPKTPPAFSYKIGCTNTANKAEVTLTILGGVPQYSYKLDTLGFQPLTGPLLIDAGTHQLTIVDGEGLSSATQEIVIPDKIQVPTSGILYICNETTQQFIVRFKVAGGKPSYTIAVTTDVPSMPIPPVEQPDPDDDTLFSIGPVPSGVKVTATITDTVGCKKTEDFSKICADTTPPEFRVIPYCDITKTPAEPGVEIFIADSGSDYAYSIITDTGIEKNGTIPGKTVKVAVPPGTKEINVTLTDQSGNNATQTVSMPDCPPCDLPCGGITRRCAYRLWIQPPAQKKFFETYDQKSPVRFRFNTDPNVDLGDTSSIFQFLTAELNNNFDDTVGRAIKDFNDRIAHKLGPDRLTISYEPQPKTDPFAILWIEYFICDIFSFEFDFVAGTPAPSLPYHVRYTNEAVIIFNQASQVETRTPAFDCRTRNLCLGTKYTPLCDKRIPKLRIIISPIGNNRYTLIGEVTNPAVVPESDIVAWIWEVPTAREPFYVGKQVVAELLTGTGIVRLTAITKTGCFAFIEENIG